ncbi:ABC transporter ATP-binding protein [Kribbella sp. NPDC056861]|uniref:ABC transporter ATP-binding protein n=1 Tax=Kribbella sp. NPDC056861 TaxID=3154857 RepID=UPI003439CEC3
MVGQERIVAVDDVSLSVAAGEFVCVYGASGSGKTTLLNLMSGIDVPDSGSVLFGDLTLSELSEQGRADARLNGIAVVFQTNNLLDEFTAHENVALPLLVRGWSRSDADQASARALKAMELGALGDRLPGELSGGQHQRVGIARALAAGHRLLIADEPTGALDSSNSRELFVRLRQLCDDEGTAVVVATHDPLAREFATVVHHMVDGAVDQQ